ncbi:MAG: PAS domain S-box protein, partial [Gemmatimonadota bacterium]
MGPFSPPTDLASAVLRTPASRALAVLTAFLLLAVVLLEPVGLSLASYRRILLVGGAGLLLLGGWVFSLRRQVRSRREAQERLESLFEHNEDTVVSLDLEGRIREANPAFQSMCGRDAGEIAGESFSSLLVAPDRNRAEEHLEEALEGRAHTLHTALTRPDGERVELE